MFRLSSQENKKTSLLFKNDPQNGTRPMKDLVLDRKYPYPSSNSILDLPVLCRGPVRMRKANDKSG